MSPDSIALIITAAGLLVTLGGGFFAGLAWVVRRMDERFDTVDNCFARVEDRFDKVDDQIRGVQEELNEVKVAVARLEGPHQRLIFPR